MNSDHDKTILIVDGCSMTRECIGALLRAKKIKILCASTIASAINLLENHTPDIIIHELLLPDGSAQDLMDQVSHTIDDSSVLHFVLTTTPNRAQLLHVIEHGVTQIMLKPEFTIDVFFHKIATLYRIRNYSADTKPKASIQPKKAAQIIPGSTEAPNEIILRTHEEAQTTLKSIKPIMPRSEIFARISEIAELKALSPMVARIMSLTKSSEASMDAITKAIRNDPAIALKIIRLANSAAFTRGDPVTTLHEAVLRMGCDQIHQAVVNIGIMDNFSSTMSNLIDPKLFWEHSIAVSICCSMIARETISLEPDKAFTLGLLHDVGRMILNQAFGDDYHDVIMFARENHFPSELIERRSFLVDHASIMNTVLHQWGLHNDFIEPIVNHHLSVDDIVKASPKRMESACVVALANRIVHSLGLGCSGNQTIYSTEDFFETLKLPQGLLGTIVEHLPEMVLDMRFTMLGELGVHNFPEPYHPLRRFDVNPIYATLNPATDAIGYWIETLKNPSSTAPPDFIVARMYKGREAVPLDGLIRDIEDEHQIKNLPIIMLSDSGKLNLPEASCTQRTIRTLETPFTMQQFEQTVQSLPLHGVSDSLASAA